MKEYEKLATEYAKTKDCPWHIAKAWEDGFLKAREMAVDYMETTGEPYFALDKLGEKEI